MIAQQSWTNVQECPHWGEPGSPAFLPHHHVPSTLYNVCFLTPSLSAHWRSTSAPTGKWKLLPLGHWMLLKVLFILVSTPFSAGSPDLFICFLASYSLSLMLLNHGPKYPLVQHVFIKHLQCTFLDIGNKTIVPNLVEMRRSQTLTPS